MPHSTQTNIPHSTYFEWIFVYNVRKMNLLFQNLSARKVSFLHLPPCTNEAGDVIWSQNVHRCIWEVELQFKVPANTPACPIASRVKLSVMMPHVIFHPVHPYIPDTQAMASQADT